MALIKSFTLLNGAAGNYVRVGYYHCDHVAREASAHLMLYVSAAQRLAAPDAPLCLIAKLRLQGATFDTYLGTAALAALADPGPDPVRDQLYAAAQAEELLAGGGLTAVSLADAESDA